MAERDALGTTPSTYGDFFAFRRMVTPIVIQVFFWLGVAAIFLFCAFLGISVIANANHTRGAEILGLICAMMFGVPLSLLLWRIYCEVLILLFRMNETLTDIRNSLEKRPDLRN